MQDKQIEIIKIPKESVSDDTVIVAMWYKENGDSVQKGEMIVTYETSKSTIDIESPCDGYLFYQIESGQETAVGEILGVVSLKKEFSWDLIKKSKEVMPKTNQESDAESPRFSKPALSLIEDNKLDKAVFSGFEMVSKDDVVRYLNQESTPPVVTSDFSRIHSNRILILGGGGYAKMCIDILTQLKTYEIVGIIDKDLAIGTNVLGVPVLGRDKDLQGFYDDGVRLAVNAIGAISNHNIREKMYQKLKDIGFILPNLIHPSASLEPSVSLGEGTHIMAHAVVGSEVRIYNNCILNSSSVISHDCLLEDNVHIAPGAILAGMVHVKKNTLIGMGSTIYLNVTIGENVTSYNGCHISKNISDHQIIRNE